MFVAVLLLAFDFSPASAAQRPPAPAAKPDFAEITTLDASIRLDIRYATANNFVGQPVYDQARAFAARPAAEALRRAHRALARHGYGILVFDAYRPWSATKRFWDAVKPEQRKFLANPKTGSVHNRGCAVDVSLYDLKTGKEAPMPSEYDEMTPRAALAYAGGTQAERRRRELLQRVMRAEGFRGVRREWWHFDYKDWKRFPVLDIPFSKL